MSLVRAGAPAKVPLSTLLALRLGRIMIPEPPILDPHPPDELSLGRMFRRFFQILTLIFCLFLVVRTTFVEPHGVPTGSMAPTIYGNHRQCPCPRCGYSIVVGNPAEGAYNPQTAAYCLNCGLSGIDMVPLSETISGDRMLVDRCVFRIRSPRRWEMAVFHAPDDTKIPYVKRVVGLPGEAIRIHDGDAYANGELLRKPLDALREMKIPLFDMDRAPQPMGWTRRWVVESVATLQLPAGIGGAPDTPIEKIVDGDRLILDASARAETTLGLSYRHRNVDTGIEELIRDDHGYNGLRGVPKPAHDFILDCEIEVIGGSGRLSFRLGNGSDSVRLDLSIGTSDRPSTLNHDGAAAPHQLPTLQFHTSQRYSLELAFVDRRATVAVDGRAVGLPSEVFVPTLGTAKTPSGLPPERRGTARPLQIEARGVSIVLRHLKLSRDVQYRAEGENAIAEAWQLGRDEYFMLGDNSPSSEDSRAWKKPGVPEGDFIGKPFLVHQPLRIGRLVLNGKEQRFQTIDWDRFRLLK